MKLILRADVENLGHLGDMVEVKSGFGRNYLLPQRLAMVASPSNLKVFEMERRKLQEKMDALRSSAGALCARLESLDIVLKMRVGENDKLYGSVTNAMISDIINEQNVEIDRRKILLDAPIRSLGEHIIRIRLHADVVANVTIKVQGEDRHVEEEIQPVAAETDSAEESVNE